MIDSFKLGNSAKLKPHDSNKATSALARMVTDRRAVTRIALIATTLIATIAAIALTRSHEARASTSASLSRAALNAPNASAEQSLEQFTATWRASVNRNAEQITLNWTANDSRDLRASLLAFDTTRPKSPRITVTRRDTSFVVNAEVAP